LTTFVKKNWNEVFQQHSEVVWDSLYRFSLSLTRNQSEAEDLTQQTLLKALQALPGFFKANYFVETPEELDKLASETMTQDLQKHLLNWMIKIAKNSFLDSRNRSTHKLNHISLEDWSESEDFFHLSSTAEVGRTHPKQQLTPDSLSQLENDFFELALDDDWQKRFEDLNARQRSIIFLSAEEYSYKEIAQLLDIPLGTVMSTLSRALSKLRKSAK